MAERPGWKYELNPNTIIQLVTLLVMFVSLGMIWQEQKNGVQRNADNIERQQNIIDELARSLVTYSNVPYRITALEARVGATEVAIRDGDRVMNQLSSDIRVMREILERLDPVSPTNRGRQ